MTSETETYHGIVFSKIVRGASSVSISQYPSKSNCSYVVNGVGIYIKYSTKRMSPWNFTFLKSHQEEIKNLKEELGQMLVVLVCGEDGIASLTYEETKMLLDERIQDVERISVSRPPRGKYKITGTDGNMKNRIGNSEFPGKIFNH